MAALLEIEDLHIFYGAIEALKGVSLTLDQGEIVTVLGANGAGKSTLLTAISGLLPIPQGTVRLHGQPINGYAAHEVVLQGISQVPEGRRVFTTLSVEENLNLGAYSRRRIRQEVQTAKQWRQIFSIIREINDQGISILLVEQNAQKALTVAGRGYVLETGSIAASGTSAQLKADPRIRAAYLGGSGLRRHEPRG